MNDQTFVCDLATRLYKSTRMRERAADDRVLLFAPDRHGMPVLVNAWVRDLLDCFRDTHGSTCAICCGEARDAESMASRGMAIEQIRDALRARYAHGS